MAALVVFVVLVLNFAPAAYYAAVPAGAGAGSPAADEKPEPAKPSPRPTPTPIENAAEKAPSVWDKVLDPATVRLLRVLLIIGGAFVLAAMVQRSIMGRFGFEAFGMKLDQLDAAKEGFDDVAAEIENLRQDTSENLAAVVEQLGGAFGEFDAALTALHNRVDAVEDAPPADEPAPSET